ncbi:DEAD/DEAH box helicase [Pseudomonas asturiensis]|uniref:DEAD/DEAH box helicase n=1 Tax=Pseudomonas asturiensis TaxID=1190415 RepID=A0A1M7QEY9_9PSED|nr:Z1 domain-containing protein [Pseudomonas asturiensis]SHN29538.1 DEAD/DEAH box helicase [Pseudomonas asturiensis]
MKKMGKFYPSFVGNNERYSSEDCLCIESVVKRLMKSQTSEDHPGMLLGKIQSGKTKIFLAVMALAFDNDFDIVVVLTKGTRALAKQTYARIKSEFKEHADNDLLNVFDIMTMPSHLTGFELSQKLVLVVKKQTDNLGRLIALFDKKYPELQDKRVLIIDDEADYASVGFKKAKGELDINTTARQLENLRRLVQRAAFLQVTATPYSLYLQPATIQIKGDVFAPVRPAFTALVPVNAAYIGSEYYFEDSQEDSHLATFLYQPVHLDELQVLRKKDGRRLKLEEVLSSKAISTLRDALCNFIVGGCIRRLQDKKIGQAGKKYSFLVHTESNKIAHAWQEELVEKIKEKLNEAAAAKSSVLVELIKRSYQGLRLSVEFQGDHLPTEAEVAKEVLNALRQDWLMITKVNSEKQIEELLDDDGQLKLRTPLNIFIGGQILDRGITIANLIGFYYGRKPNIFQQDTVLQHSRMFGFRPLQDLAVTRFYTEPTIYVAMQRMHENDVALREALSKNPEQPVVFIQKGPGNSVLPCSPNKIALSRTTTLKPHKRILPVGFQTLSKTSLKPITEKIDKALKDLVGENVLTQPILIDVSRAIELLDMTQAAFKFDPGYSFDWSAARSTLTYLSGLSKGAGANKVWLMTYSDRNVSRLAGKTSHAEYIEPDSTRTEGKIRIGFALDNPIIILIRQNGNELPQGWRGGAFWWPVISAQSNTRTAIFAHETLSND